MTDTNSEIKIGDETPEGTVFAGMSPDTGEAMYALKEDQPGRLTLRDVTVSPPVPGFRLPSSNELKVLFNNRAAIGGFHEEGGSYRSWYWSGTRTDDKGPPAYPGAPFYQGALAQNFGASTESQFDCRQDHAFSVRLMRTQKL